MAVFYVLLLFPLAIQHFGTDKSPLNYERRCKNALRVFFCILTALIMLRHKSVGADTNNYIRIFDSFREMNWQNVSSTHYEIGFAILMKTLSAIFVEPQMFLAIVAIAVSIMIYPTYKRLCTDPSLTIVLYCIMSTFFLMFSGVRQMLAIGVGVIAYEHTRQKRLLYYVLTVLAAMTIHTSAFMLAFMYPLYHAKVTRKWLFVVAPMILVIFVYNRPIFTFLTVVLERFTEYDGSITFTGAYTMLVLFAVFAIFAFVIPDETLLDAEAIGLRNFLLLSLVIQMFAPLHSLAMRMNYYYIIFIPLLLPKTIQCRSEQWSQMAVLGRHIMVVFFLLYFFLTASEEGSLHVFPYHFFWESV